MLEPFALVALTSLDDVYRRLGIVTIPPIIVRKAVTVEGEFLHWQAKPEVFMRARDPRFPADKDVHVVLGDDVRRAQLVNISSTGARLGQIGDVPRNTLLTLSYRHYRFSAQVMWTDGEDSGVRFLIPLSRAEMNALRSQASGGVSRPDTSGLQSHVFLENRWP